MSRNYHAKHLARDLGIPYAEALRRVQDGTASVKATRAVADPVTMEQRLLAEVRRECWDMIGGDVAYRFRGGVVAGWHFADELQLPSPPRVKQMQIHAIETDYATLRWLPE